MTTEDYSLLKLYETLNEGDKGYKTVQDWYEGRLPESNTVTRLIREGVIKLMPKRQPPKEFKFTWGDSRKLMGRGL